MAQPSRINPSNSGSLLARHAWLVTDGNAGMITQAIGLAKALNYDYTIKNITLRYPWRWLAPYILLGSKYAIDPISDNLKPPYPELIIASGRKSILPALLIKKLSQGLTKVIYIQNPQLRYEEFDLIISPSHDRLAKPNVINILGSIHQVNDSFLNQEAAKFKEQFSRYSKPIVSVLLGGPNSVFAFNKHELEKLILDIKTLHNKHGHSFLITPSRRTPKEIKKLFAKFASTHEYVYFWDEKGENPYYAMLALANFIIVTPDSINQVTESCNACANVYLYPLEGKPSKFSKFHNQLVAKNNVRFFNGSLKVFNDKKLNNMQDIVANIRKIQLLTK